MEYRGAIICIGIVILTIIFSANNKDDYKDVQTNNGFKPNIEDNYYGLNKDNLNNNQDKYEPIAECTNLNETLHKNLEKYMGINKEGTYNKVIKILNQNDFYYGHKQYDNDNNYEYELFRNKNNSEVYLIKWEQDILTDIKHFPNVDGFTNYDYANKSLIKVQ